MLEGSVQRLGNQIRVNAQLIDAETGAHLWAERFDRDIADLFAVQDEITRRIAEALRAELVTKEAARLTEHPDALDFILRGRAEMLKPNSPKVYAAAVGYFEHALTVDPASVEARGWLAEVLANRALDGMSNSRNADLARAEELVRQVLAASPTNPAVHSIKGEILRAQGRFTEALKRCSNSTPTMHGRYSLSPIANSTPGRSRKSSRWWSERSASARATPISV